MSEVFDIQQQWFDPFGGFMIGGKVYYGKPNTDPTLLVNQIPVFSDRAFTVAAQLPNPQTIGFDGRVENKPWLNQRYSIQVNDKDAVLRFSSQDNGENPSTGQILPLSNVDGINDITAETPGGISEYENQQIFTLRTVATNTGNMTIDIDGVGAVPLRINGEEIPAGAILVDLGIEFSYNSLEVQFDLLSPISSASPGAIGETNPNSIKGTDIEGETIKGTDIEGETIKATTTFEAIFGTTINEFSTDDTLSGDSDDAVPTEKAVKTYADTKIEDAVSTVDAGNLKTVVSQHSTGTQSLLVTSAAGLFGFWPQISVTIANRVMCTPSIPFNAVGVNTTPIIGGSPLTRLWIGTESGTFTAGQNYVQASPPYDIGDGEVNSFIFLLVENGTGKILASCHAPDPLWANNGPTCIRPEYHRKDGGILKPFRKRCIIDPLKSFEDPERYSIVEQEITAEFKNSDMALLPHPYQGNDLTGKTIVLIDPNDPIVLRAEEMKEAGEQAAIELFFNDYVRFGNEHLEGRHTPCQEVMVVKPSWKNNK